MKYAIGCKLVQCEEMNLGDYNEYRGWTIPQNEDPKKPGYLVKYVDQNPPYISWSPKEVFEKFYLPIQSEDGSKLEESDIDLMFKVESGEALPDGKSTFVKGNTLTGFVQYDVSSCVDPKNYDHQIGIQVCSTRMKNTIWKCMGFVLQWAKYGLNNKG